MNSISKHSGDNQGGHQKLEFIPITQVTKFPLIVDGVITASEDDFTITGTWYDLYFSPESDEITENLSPGESGDVYRVRIQPRIGGDSSALRENLREMRSERFIVRATARGGQVRIYGSLDEPLQFEYAYRSARGSAGLKGYDLRFYGDQSDLAPIYIGS